MQFSFSIDKIEYHVPLELDLDLFSKAMAWDISIEQNMKPFVSVITSCPMHKLDLLDSQTYEIVCGICISRITLDETTLHKKIQHSGIYHALIDFDELSFGQFIDMDVFISDGLAKNAVQITSKLYETSEEVASQFSVNKVWQALLKIAQYRESLYMDYSEFFELDNNEDISEEIDTSISLNRLQLMWYEAVLVLANHDFLNINRVTQRPIREALNFLTWKKNEVAKQKLENLKRKNDLQRTRR